MLGYQRQVLNIPAGITKEDNDFTALTYTDADKIRFDRGLPQKIGGWQTVSFGNAQDLDGVPRQIYSYVDDINTEHILIGTHTRLYVYQNGNLYNITPLVTSTTAIANSLATNYSALGATPIAITNGSRLITVTFAPLTSVTFQQGDSIKISGVLADIGNITAASLNTTHVVTSVTATTLQFSVATTATSSATGGAGAVLATKVITVSHAAHGFKNGDRIKIASSANMGGLLAADINVEGIVRYVNANTYKYYLESSTNYATSSVSSAGGAATTVQGQIAAGNCSITTGGYGAGAYGVGAYGVGGAVSGLVAYPRIWSFGRYNDGTTIGCVMTPGDQTGVYYWDNDLLTAPTLLTNAPTAVNYLFVAEAENVIVTFGDGAENNIHTSDVGDATVWTADSTNNVFNRAVAGAARLISHAYVRGQYLLFTNAQVYFMYFVNKPDIWIVRQITSYDGLIGPNAVVELPDIVVWMGNNNFYSYNGSIHSVLPNNGLLNWILDNYNSELSYLTCCYVPRDYGEVWWFIAFDSDEPDTYVIWNYVEGHFTNGKLQRTASETHENPSRNQYMAVGMCDGSISTTLYIHEIGFAADNEDMVGSLSTNYTLIGGGDYIQNISEIIPSNLRLPIGTSKDGEVIYSLTVNTKEYDGAIDPRVFGPYIVQDNTQKINTRIVGRQRQYVYNFANEIGFRIQKCFEAIKPFTKR